MQGDEKHSPAGCDPEAGHRQRFDPILRRSRPRANDGDPLPGAGLPAVLG